MLNLYGIQNKDELNMYLHLIKTASPFEYMDCLLKTNKPNILSTLGESEVVATVLKNAMVEAGRTNDSEQVRIVIKALDTVPFSPEILKKFGLKTTFSNFIKGIKGDKEAWQHAQKLKFKWMGYDQPSKDTTSSDGMYAATFTGSIDASNDDYDKTGLSTNKPKPRLAIDKDPPRSAVTKPKALQDTNFFSGLLNNSQPKGYRIRPAVPKQPPAWSASSQAPSGSTAPLMNVNNSINANNKPRPVIDYKQLSNGTQTMQPTNNDYVSQNAAIMSTKPAITKAKKRVQFSSDLCQVRVYHPDPDEWSAFDASIDDIFETFPWHMPPKLTFETVPEPVTTRQRIETDEVVYHKNRERRVLAAVYIMESYIPPSPAEPDEVPNPNDNVPIIPTDMEDICESSSNQLHVEKSNNIPQQQQQQTVYQPVIHQQYHQQPSQNQISQQLYQQQPYQQPTYAPYKQKQQYSHVSYQQQQPVQPNLNRKRAAASEDMIQTMLDAHPWLANSLKELSFLQGDGEMEKMTSSKKQRQ
ncbi:hypothetical protein RMATCC62417_05911 [Rhizopus microsporus]|nr:hypothetical protein RMATCC62417_05911 [Rhizopus microsporus]